MEIDNEPWDKSYDEWAKLALEKVRGIVGKRVRERVLMQNVNSAPLTAEALAAFADEACAEIMNIHCKTEGETDLVTRNIQEKLPKKYPQEDTMPVIHGKWIWNENGHDWGLGAFVCSECKCVNHNLPDNRYNPYMFMGSRYCPNCGAKMDE